MMATITEKLGFCGSCGTVQPVSPIPGGIPGFVGEQFYWVLVAHRIVPNGPWCDGGGDVPQALVEEEEIRTAG
jgi:hypothetical protein